MVNTYSMMLVLMCEIVNEFCLHTKRVSLACIIGIISIP